MPAPGATSGETGTFPSVILLADAPGDRENANACLELMAPIDPRDIDTLYVGLTRQTSPRFEQWRTHGGGRPARMKILSAAGKTRSSAASSNRPTAPTGSPQIETIAHPGNLTQLGVQITRSLEQFESSENELTVCFHSLTALLQYHTEATIYRFLNVLTNLLVGADAIAHVHVDPAVHDDRTIDRMKPLFDDVIDASRSRHPRDGNSIES